MSDKGRTRSGFAGNPGGQGGALVSRLKQTAGQSSMSEKK
ncbi:hypothetical protein LHK_02378 [Laribacter hongkongensis HLHK9]|uniref:Uncharacterized protein n=1 Tax=Laribacter hongkongensis (strain HLHK9) TaxID=557598 RepID=C1DB21_LARHH|nr:hypothetical protein LHK_02378 [Laribacter hongkongensis HLHK9]